jgi:hypothetical protein
MDPLRGAHLALDLRRAEFAAAGNTAAVAAITRLKTGGTTEEVAEALVVLERTTRPTLVEIAAPLVGEREFDKRMRELAQETAAAEAKAEASRQARLAAPGLATERRQQLLVEAVEGALPIMERSGHINLRLLEETLPLGADVLAAVLPELGLGAGATLGDALEALDRLRHLEQTAAAICGINSWRSTSGRVGESLKDKHVIAAHVAAVRERIAARTKVAAAR